MSSGNQVTWAPGRNYAPSFFAKQPSTDNPTWGRWVKGIMAAAGILSAFIPGLEELAPQLIIGSMIGAGDLTINHYTGIQNTWYNDTLEFAPVAMGGAWQGFKNLKEYDEFTKVLEDLKEFSKTESIAKVSIRNKPTFTKTQITIHGNTKGAWGAVTLRKGKAATFFGKNTKEIKNFKFKYHDFYDNTGLSPEDIRYSKMMRNKADITWEKLEALNDNPGTRAAWEKADRELVDNTTNTLKGLAKGKKLGAALEEMTDPSNQVQLKNVLIGEGYDAFTINRILKLLDMIRGQKVTQENLLELMTLLKNNINKTFFNNVMELKAQFVIRDKDLTELNAFMALIKKTASVSERKGKLVIQDSVKTKIDETIIEKNKEKVHMSKGKLLNKVTFATRMLNPTTAIRAPINYVYHKLAKKVEKYLLKIMKSVKLPAKVMGKSAKEFLEHGGVPVDSEWILGYKIIIDDPLNMLCMISFIPEATNGKVPVMVWASSKQLAELRLSPGQTYLKYWAISQGGKSVSLGYLLGFNISGKEGSLIDRLAEHTAFTFMSVNNIRNILSIVSNIKKFTLRTVHREEFKDFWHKIEKSAINTSISRAVRLVSRKAGGTVADALLGHVAKHIIGMELQRYSTVLLVQGFKNHLQGKKWIGAQQLANLKYGATRTIRDQARFIGIRKFGKDPFFVSKFKTRMKTYRRIPGTIGKWKNNGRKW